MLKFTADRGDKPTAVGLGLSWDNLQRLRKDAIQFRGSDLQLGQGIFVIAHDADPELPHYQMLVGGPVCDLVVLSDAHFTALQSKGEVLKLPLRSTREGKGCEALLFAGKTEEILLQSMKKQGMLAPDAKITMMGAPAAAKAPEAPKPPDPGAASRVQVDETVVFAVDILNKLKLLGGGIGFVIATFLVMSKSRGSFADFLVLAIMLVTAGTLLTLFYLRTQERIEMDSEGLRCIRPLAPFSISWSELSAIRTREDSLGPYELHLVRASGRSHKLNRIYAGWDDLVADILKRASARASR